MTFNHLGGKLFVILLIETLIICKMRVCEKLHQNYTVIYVGYLRRSENCRINLNDYVFAVMALFWENGFFYDLITALEQSFLIEKFISKLL